MSRLLSLCFVSLIAVLAAAPTLAQGDRASTDGSVEQGDFTIHYSLFPSTFLTSEVAGAYGIVRAKNRAVINVSVRERQAPDSDREQSARVSGRYSDLIQNRDLDFREIREQGALYYIAEFRHGNAETLRFDLKVQPEGGREQNITFTRKLYVDE
jgi:hypothetical protein